MPRAPSVAATLLLALAAAWAARALQLPLPWLVGPLMVTALAGVAGAPVAASQRLRNLGQWAIGVALGLTFSPSVAWQLLQLAPYVLVGVAWALALGWGFHRLLRRLNPDQAPATTFFAGAIGGASEMALLAERHGARVDLVASAHSLRVILVVLSLPFAFHFAGVQGIDAGAAAARRVDPAGLSLLTALTLGGVAAMHRLRLPSPWVLGALAVTLVLAVAGKVPSGLPREASNLGQLFIGVALGARFTPQFARSAPRWMGSVLLSSLVLIVLSAGFGSLLALAAGLHPATGVLATAPGGIAEMCITATVLQLGVPVVTAFQVLRYLAVLLLTASVFRWELGRLRRRSDHPPDM